MAAAPVGGVPSARADLAWGAAVTLLGPLVALRGMVASGLALLPGDTADSRLLAFVLEHSWGWVRGAGVHSDLWSPPIFWPVRGTLAYSDALLGFAPLYWPWRAVGLRADTSFQLWMLAALALSAATAYVLLTRGVGLSPAAAAPGAWLTVFAASRLHHVSHAQLLPMFWVLGALLAAVLWARAEGRRRRAGLLLAAGGCLVAQLYSGVYMAVFVVLLLFALLGWALVLPSTRRAVAARLRADAPALLVVAALAGLALAPWLAHYRAAARLVGVRGWHEVEPRVPRPASWLYVTPAATFYRRAAALPVFARLPDHAEQPISPGWWTLAASTVAAVAARRRPAAQLAAAAALTLVLLTTGGEHSIWRWVVEAAPPLASIRAISRIGLLLPLAAAVLLGAWADQSIWADQAIGADQAAAPGRRRLLLLAAWIACLEQLAAPSYVDKTEQRRWVAAVAERVDPRATAFYVSRLGGRQRTYELHLDAMWAASVAGVPTVNGASGNEPPGYEALNGARARLPENRERLRRALRDWVEARGGSPAGVQWIELPSTQREQAPTARPARASDVE